MDDLLALLRDRVERGKERLDSRYPPDLRDEAGADELCRRALEAGATAAEILDRALTPAMRRVGERFASGEVFVPQLLMSARAMKAAMEHLKPAFAGGEVSHRGTVVIGTVAGDLHDIGKNVVAMVLEGDGWNVVDLGVDVGADRFLEALGERPGGVLAMSSLLTTTMMEMETVIERVRSEFPPARVFVGGAPITSEFADLIGADGTFPEPHGFARHLAEGRDR
ncbi:MAG: cobalamin-dependent protein [Planctomycetota bacterium]|jgi:5-methyltetrahydrofolate--homocysteine methyltransferase